MGHYIVGSTNKSLKYNPRPFQPTRQFRDDSLGCSSLNKQLGMEEDWMVGVDHWELHNVLTQFWPSMIRLGGIMSGLSGLGFVVVKSNQALNTQLLAPKKEGANLWSSMNWKSSRSRPEDMMVSRVCGGTMMWGTLNKEESHAPSYCWLFSSDSEHLTGK